MIDSAERLAALNSKESFIVGAPAGSGKTEVLVRRILSLLLEVDHPHSILAITFTRKAAAEMKQRLFEAIQAEQHEDPEKQDLVKAVRLKISKNKWSMEELERLSIITIDALCARILNQEGRIADTEAKTLPDYQLLGDALMFELLEHLETKDQYAASLEMILLYFGNNIEKVKKLFLDILSKRAEWLSVFVPRAQAESLQQELSATVASLYQRLFENWQKLAPKQWVAAIQVWLGITCAAALKKVAALLLTQQGELRKRFDVRLGLAPELKGAYQDMLAALAADEALPEWLTLLREIQVLPPINYQVAPLTMALLQILPLIAAHWQVLLREHHYRDFQEEALQAVLTLSSNDPVAHALLRFERELQHILVDEFQDTSRLQFRLLELMTETWLPGDGRSLFLVGDPMQSIYRFRDAQVALFLEAEAKGIGCIKLKSLTLQANFRTDPTVLTFINQHLSEIFPKHADTLTGAVRFIPSTAQRNYADAVGVEVLSFTEPVLEAEAIRQKVQALLRQDSGAKIGILARARSHLTGVMRALSAEHIAFQAEAWGNLLDAQIVLDLLHLTFAVTHLGDRLSWMAFLRSPMLALSLDELLLLAQDSEAKIIWSCLNDKGFQAKLSPISKEKIERLLLLLNPLIFNPNLWLLTKVKRAFAALTVEYQFSHLEQSMIDQYWQFLSLHPVITSRQSVLQDLSRLKLNYGGEAARVILSTIHQAKGLEFDYVFFPQLQQGVRREDPPLMRWEEFYHQGEFKLLLGLHKNAEGDEDPAYQYLSALARSQNAHEQLRLLYVALTRAKKGLFLSYSETKHKPAPAGSFLKLLGLAPIPV